MHQKTPRLSSGGVKFIAAAAVASRPGCGIILARAMPRPSLAAALARLAELR
jgi:hypothetical protein